MSLLKVIYYYNDCNLVLNKCIYPGFNIQSSFTVQNPRAQLVKIEHMILLYLSSANSDSALLTITHKNRALLTMASADRFAEIVEEQI